MQSLSLAYWQVGEYLEEHEVSSLDWAGLHIQMTHLDPMAAQPAPPPAAQNTPMDLPLSHHSSSRLSSHPVSHFPPLRLDLASASRTAPDRKATGSPAYSHSDSALSMADSHPSSQGLTRPTFRIWALHPRHASPRWERHRVQRRT